MSIINPHRLLTKAGMTRLLASIDGSLLGGYWNEADVSLVKAAEVAPDGKSILSRELGETGLETPVTLTMGTVVRESEAGKVYLPSTAMTWTAAAVTGPQTIVGVLFGLANTAADSWGYCQFDDPIVIDEDGEVITLYLEFGFDGQSFYVTPRIVEFGA